MSETPRTPDARLPGDWASLRTAEFTKLDFARTVAVLPVGAIEQHGPHLPIVTDTAINKGILDRAFGDLSEGTPILRLPTQPIGKSNEHQGFPGTLSLSGETLYRLWYEIGVSVKRAGVRKLLIFNSHGGQPQIAQLVARDLRVEQQMFVVAASWFDFGLPDGFIEPDEAKHGIHGGQIETAMMQALTPKLVDATRAADFPTQTLFTAETAPRLTSLGAKGWGWQAQDINPAGVVGNAAIGTAAIGEAIIAHAATALAELLLEMTEVPLHIVMGQPRLED